MSDVNKMLELADWLKHMQGVNASVAHIPEMAGHIANLKEWESAVRSLDVAAGPQADVPQTARMQEVSRIVRMLLTNDAFPEYRMDDDRGLEESEYVDFAMRVLSALSTSTACGYSEQPWTGAQPLYAAQPQADGVRDVERFMAVVRSRWNFEENEFDVIEKVISDPDCFAVLKGAA